jgi:hypothetical protein
MSRSSSPAPEASQAIEARLKRQLAAIRDELEQEKTFTKKRRM